jgi:putative FmdB family regulatory protein
MSLMPIYEYECTQCGSIEEVLQNFSDKPHKKCPACSGKLHKLISHSTFHLKGSGWYVTDYANQPKKSDNTNSTPPSKETSSSKPEKKAKTEKKPAKEAS